MYKTTKAKIKSNSWKVWDGDLQLGHMMFDVMINGLFYEKREDLRHISQMVKHLDRRGAMLRFTMGEKF